MALAPTGRSFAAATTEGLLVYTLDQGLVFDPTDLAQDVMPEAAHAALAEGQALRAALIALRLRDGGLLRHALLSTPPEQVLSGFICYSRTCLTICGGGPLGPSCRLCVTSGLPWLRGCPCAMLITRHVWGSGLLGHVLLTLPPEQVSFGSQEGSRA